MKLVDIEPLMKNGWHLVQTGESNRFLRSMSLADVPIVDAVEVVHGRCGYCRGTSYTDKPFKVITQMGREVEVQFNYCPNCGAKMDG